MLAIIKDGVLVVRDDPRLQLVHGALLINVDAFRDPVREGRRGVRAWRAVASLLSVFSAMQAVVSVCGPGPGFWKILIQQIEFLASLSAHVHTGNILAYIRELLCRVTASHGIFALELYHHGSYHAQVSLARSSHLGDNRNKVLPCVPEPVCEGWEFCC